jgi:DnaK suppressor protein
MRAKEQTLEHVRMALLERARALRSEISAKLGDAATDASGSGRQGDYGDQAFASGESSLDLAEAGRDLQELRGIEAAVSAIDDGSYGSCVDCGDEIALARLQAQPLAMRCTACQQRAERARGERPGSL